MSRRPARLAWNQTSRRSSTASRARRHRPKRRIRESSQINMTHQLKVAAAHLDDRAHSRINPSRKVIFGSGAEPVPDGPAVRQQEVYAVSIARRRLQCRRPLAHDHRSDATLRRQALPRVCKREADPVAPAPATAGIDKLSRIDPGRRSSAVFTQAARVTDEGGRLDARAASPPCRTSSMAGMARATYSGAVLPILSGAIQKILRSEAKWQPRLPEF